jgi:putative spermidine/putrescine transport system ATP-binding protein
MSTSSHVLELERVSKRYGRTEAVRDVSLSVRRGEFLTLLGPSGSGKTTILKMIAGFELPSDGTIQLNGRDISSVTPGARGIGIVFQHYALFPHLTVLENVGYPLRVRHWPKAKRNARAREVLSVVKLNHLEDRFPKQLSGGEQQRVAIARARAFDPALLLMDEPLGALDRALRIDMQEEVKRLHREFGTTIVYVTHDQEEALALSDRIGVLNHGQLVELATPRELYENPSTSFVATFFGGANLLPVSDFENGDEGTTALTRWGKITVPHYNGTNAPKLAVQPRYVGLQPSDSPSLAVPVVVDEVIYRGYGYQITGLTDDGIVIHGIADAPTILPPPGAKLTLHIEVSGVRLVEDGSAGVPPGRDTRA